MQPKSKSRLEISPGPGRYDPAHEKVRPKSSAWKFSPSRQSRDQSRNAFSPGPGQYKTIDTFG
jgi:Sperm-tail PG-rich repeat